jgi:tRNA(Ile2) C34 agmatinyltransferase TiaS
MTNKKAVKLICRKCGHIVSVGAKGGRCNNCKTAYAVSAREAPKRSHKKQDVLAIPKGIRALVTQFVVVVIALAGLVLWLASQGGG